MRQDPFKLKATVIPFQIETAEGVAVDHELREMAASARDEYLNSLGDRVRIDKDGRPIGVKNFKGMQSDLLVRCLFLKGEDKPIPASAIQSWPSSVVAELYKEAQTLNHLNQTEKEVADESKNA